MTWSGRVAPVITVLTAGWSSSQRIAIWAMLMPSGTIARTLLRMGTPTTRVNLGELKAEIAYEPAESRTAMYGGNSNWRGPVWFPINYLMINAQATEAEHDPAFVLRQDLDRVEHQRDHGHRQDHEPDRQPSQHGHSSGGDERSLDDR